MKIQIFYKISVKKKIQMNPITHKILTHQVMKFSKKKPTIKEKQNNNNKMEMSMNMNRKEKNI